MIEFKTKAYFRFLWNSKNQYGIHSPYVYDLITQCFYKHLKRKTYKKLKRHRKHYKKNHPNFKALDERFSLKKSKFIHRLTTYFSSQNLLDLSGTKGYIANIAHAENNLVMDEELLLNTSNHRHISCNPTINNLKKELQKINTTPFDFIFLGKDHIQPSWEKIYASLESHINPQTILVVEGIHLYEENESFWKEIEADENINVTIDVFYWGIVSFRRNQAKQQFTIRV